MIDPLQALLQAAPLNTLLFPPSSRYHGIETEVLETSDGTSIIYLRRRFIAPPERFALLQEHAVTQGERLDTIATRYLGDPEQFWRICDANAAIRPEELIEQVGRRLRITLPEDVPGVSGA
jgi:hypothetical protein